MLRFQGTRRVMDKVTAIEALIGRKRKSAVGGGHHHHHRYYCVAYIVHHHYYSTTAAAVVYVAQVTVFKNLSSTTLD